MLWIIVLVLLVLVLFASIPAYPYSRDWGYSPAGLLLVLVVVFVVLMLTGIIDINGDGEDVNVDVNSAIHTLHT